MKRIKREVYTQPLSAIWHQRQLDRATEARPGSKRVRDGRRFVTAMYHAVFTLVVSPSPVAFPIRRLQQFLECCDISFLEQVTRLLPAKYVVGGIAPWRALVFPLAHQEVQEQRRLIETPGPLAIPQNTPKELMRATAFQEILLIRSLLIAVSRRDHHAFDAKLHHLVEKRAHA